MVAEPRGTVDRERQGAQSGIEDRRVGGVALAGKRNAAKDRVVRDVTVIGRAVVVKVDRAVAIVEDHGVIGGGVVIEGEAAAGIGDIRGASLADVAETHAAADIADRGGPGGAGGDEGQHTACIVGDVGTTGGAGTGELHRTVVDDRRVAGGRPCIEGQETSGGIGDDGAALFVKEIAPLLL